MAEEGGGGVNSLSPPAVDRHTGPSPRISSHDGRRAGHILHCVQTTARRVVRAELFQQSIPAHRIAECDQLLGKKLHAHWQAMVLQQLLREQGEDPVAAEDFAHWVSGSGAGQRLVLFGTPPSLSSRPAVVARRAAPQPSPPQGDQEQSPTPNLPPSPRQTLSRLYRRLSSR